MAYFNIDHAVFDDVAYISTTSVLNIPSTAETPLLLFRCPSGATGRSLITKFKVGTESVRSTFRFYYAPTITSDGTALAENNTCLGGSRAAECEVYSLPTISSNGTLFEPMTIPEQSASQGVNRFLMFVPNREFLVTVKNAVSNAKSFATVFWVEGIRTS